MRFNVTYVRECTATIDAVSINDAGRIARLACDRTPGSKVLHILAEGAVLEHISYDQPEKPKPPRGGKPNGGGTIGGGQIKLHPEPLCDAIAERKAA